MFAWTHSGSLHAGGVAELLQLLRGPGQAANQSIKACTIILQSGTSLLLDDMQIQCYN